MCYQLSNDKKRVQKMQLQTTERLFYNKWPIKVECRIHGASFLNRNGIDLTIRTCNGEKTMFDLDRKNIDKIDLKKFAKIVKPILETGNVQVRTEGKHYNIFLSDRDLFAKIKKDLYPWITHITSPSTDEEFNFLMNNGHKKVLCAELPHKKFRYRVYLKERTSRETRGKFLKWAENYKDKSIKISKTTEVWLNGGKFYIQNPFFYVENEKMLSMMLLFLDGNHRKVQEFILKSSINT